MQAQAAGLVLQVMIVTSNAVHINACTVASEEPVRQSAAQHFLPGIHLSIPLSTHHAYPDDLPLCMCCSPDLNPHS